LAFSIFIVPSEKERKVTAFDRMGEVSGKISTLITYFGRGRVLEDSEKGKNWARGQKFPEVRL